MGIPVVISTNGYGVPIREVEKNAPVLEISENGYGMPIVLSDLGAPAVINGVWGPGWVPNGAVLAVDWANDQYWSKADGEIFDPTSVTRSTTACLTATDGKTITSFAANTLRRDSRGAYIEGYDRTRYSVHPNAPASWSTLGSVGRSTLAADGSFTPQTVARGTSGSASHALRDSASGRSLTSGDRICIRSLYKAGTSGRFRTAIRALTGNNTIIAGAVGSLASFATTLGIFGDIVNSEYPGSLHQVAAGVTINASPTDAVLEVGPDASVDAQDVTIYGSQMVKEAIAGEWILDTPTGSFTQSADQGSISVSGAKTVSIDFTLLGYASGGTNPVIWHYGDASDYVRLIYEVSTGKLLAQAYSGGAQQCSLDLGVVTIGADHVVGFAFDDDSFAASLSGAAAVTDSSGTAPTGMATLYLGQDSAAGNGAIVRVRSLFVFTSRVSPESVS